MRIGFIGVGNIAKAIINGLLEKNFNKECIYVHSAHKDNYEKYSELTGVNACSSNSEVVKKSDVIFLAIKPIITKEVIAEIKSNLLKYKPTIVSVISGVSIEDLETMIGSKNINIIRTMPNVNVEICQGMTALHKNVHTSNEEFNKIKQLFSEIGKIIEISQKDFSTFVALAGSSPAFVYFFIDSLARSGVKYGLKKDEATRIVAQAVLGSAAKILSSNKTPWELIDDVSSPGGTTIAGLLAMEEAGFMTSIVKAVDATIAKDNE